VFLLSSQTSSKAQNDERIDFTIVFKNKEIVLDFGYSSQILNYFRNDFYINIACWTPEMLL